MSEVREAKLSKDKEQKSNTEASNIDACYEMVPHRKSRSRRYIFVKILFELKRVVRLHEEGNPV